MSDATQNVRQCTIQALPILAHRGIGGRATLVYRVNDVHIRLTKGRQKLRVAYTQQSAGAHCKLQ